MKTTSQNRQAKASLGFDPTRMPSQPFLQMIGLAVLGLVLVWLILTRTLAAAWAETSPETALALQSGEPTALLNLARSKLEVLLKSSKQTDKSGQAAGGDAATADGVATDRLSQLSKLAEAALLKQESDEKTLDDIPSTPGMSASTSREEAAASTPAPGADLQIIRQLTSRAIGAAPLNADALEILGQLEELSGHAQRTESLMRAASRLSVRESYANYWLMDKAEKDSDRSELLKRADTLLRTRGAARPLAVPAIARVAEQGGLGAVVELLQSDPPWRDTFFRLLPRSITDVRTPLYILQALKSADRPPRKGELANYLQFLFTRKHHELAYYTWLQFMSPEELATMSPIYNASFEKSPSGLPFDWTLTNGSGFVSEIRAVPDKVDEHALVIEFTQGRAEYKSISQYTLLGPGTYTLRGQHKGGLISKRGLRWRVSCADQRPEVLLGEGDLIRGDILDWREFSLTFTVPPAGCRAQQIHLDLDARSPSEQLITGLIWFDKFEVKRAG